MVESCVIAVADYFVIAAAIDFYFTFLAFNLVEELSFNLKLFVVPIMFMIVVGLSSLGMLILGSII